MSHGHGVDQENILSHFDAAVANSEIIYSPTNYISFFDDDFQFQFRLCPHLHRKPQLPPTNPPPDSTKSDIVSSPSLYITAVPPSHDLIFNAYPVLRPSYLLLTTSPLLRQTSPLSLADITAARTTLHGLCRNVGSGNSETDEKNEEEYLIIYNCGRASGCSRFHKHMQVLPRPPRTIFPLWPDHLFDRAKTPVNVPYASDLTRHPPSPTPSAPDDPDVADRILARYTSALRGYRTLLDIPDGEPVPHNVVMTREWTVVIPRRAASVGGIGTNAAGMLGMVWVATQAEFQEWQRRGPWNVLGQLGWNGE